jgi:hypothetical protein
MEEYRERARQKLLPHGYSGYWHLGKLFAGCSLVCVVCAARMESTSPLEWLAVPLMFLICNGYEYGKTEFSYSEIAPLAFLINEN